MYQIKNVKVSDLKPYDKNARTHSAEQVSQIMQSIKEFGFTNPLLIDSNYNLIAGHGRLEAIKRLNKVDFAKMPILELPCVICEGLSEAQIKALVIADNKIALNAGWDLDLLADELRELDSIGFDLDLTGFGKDEISELLGDTKLENWDNDDEKRNLVDIFLVPPFSILDTRAGVWQERKKAWIEKGLRSDLGRDNEILGAGLKQISLKAGGFNSSKAGISIFDPVLCEVLLKWFNVDNGSVLDCFAGGSVRGIVSEVLGHKYTGIDLRDEQIKANIENARDFKVMPKWICGDSVNIKDLVKNENGGGAFDMILSCPPYFNLERYSDLENDISNMSWENFKRCYKDIIKNTCDLLKNNRFAVFVVGDVRDKQGIYLNFIDYTKQCFLDCGLCFYNDLILVNAVGTGAFRCAKPFNSNRKVFKCHQNVLVFYKGDLSAIKQNFKSFYDDDFNVKGD